MQFFRQLTGCVPQDDTDGVLKCWDVFEKSFPHFSNTP